MRIRLQWLLPLIVALVVAAGFVLAAVTVGDAVRAALLTVPGLTRERAVESAVASVILAGVVATLAAGLAAALLSRMVVEPLRRMRAATARSDTLSDYTGANSPLAEIQDLGRRLEQAAVDVRERHARDERERVELTGLLESISEGILQMDAEGRIARVNPAGRALLGLPDEAVGRPVASLLRSGPLRRAMQSGGDGGQSGGREVLVDDRRLLVSVTPQPTGGAVATFVDLTDLRRLEEVRRDFVANASHELKTPLTSIRGYTETLLAGDPTDEERRQFLTIVSRNADRLQRIVDDLLDLSRLESGRWEPRLEVLAVDEIAESAWLAFADRAAAQGVGFTVETDEGRVFADRRALEQVFTNLYDNALRYTSRGGRIRVTSRLQGATGSGRGVLVTVADTGAGIPRDAIPRIFERFYRVDPARSRSEGGTGLGLAIVKHMVEGMGGTIDAESALGKGTTMRLRLPAGEP